VVVTAENASRLLWTVAIVVALFDAVLSVEHGQTGATVLLFVVAFFAGVLGGLVDLLRWVTR
jgi:hypothetical protein